VKSRHFLSQQILCSTAVIQSISQIKVLVDSCIVFINLPANQLQYIAVGLNVILVKILANV